MHRTVSMLRKVLAALLVAGASATAGASPGNGIRLGGSEGRLHPFLDVESRYDSNVAFTAADEAIPDIVLHVRPGLELKLPGDLAAIEFSGALDWAQYLGIEEDTSDLSRLYAQAGLAAVFARRSPVSLRVDNDFRRHVSTSSLSAASSAVVANTNTLTVSVPWTPGGGALVVSASGQWRLETFEDYQDEASRLGVDLGELGYSQFRGGAEVQWRFLPRTTALLQGGYYTRVPSGSRAIYEADGFDVLAGITGLLTQRIAATVKGGYGSTSTPIADAQTAVAEASLEWLPIDALSLSAGYARGFGFDPTVSVYVRDGVSAGARLKMANGFAFRVGARYDFVDFRAIPGGADTTFLTVDPTIEGIVGRWLTMAVGYVYSSRVASWPVGSPPDYAKNEAFLRLGVTY
jgi:hypothetical protein